ncbi:phage tail protein I [Babesia caballi]|uniref:Phage tail protein I n=1 Tax=Babesia caballi TaxID=5871 RepID=A0AAV4M234_BABCB|nr:phage tail protein I [Babesia caballi]
MLFDIGLKLLGEFDIWAFGSGKGRSRCLNVRARPTALNKSRQEALAVEVGSHGAVGKRQIAPPTAMFMTPPVYVGEGLVVKRQAAEENLGALSLVIITTHFAPIGIMVERRICFSLKLGDEGGGGVANGGEDGGIGVICKFRPCFKIVDIAV